MLGQSSHSGAASGARPGEVGEGERAHRSRLCGGDQRDGRSGAAQGVGELGIGGAQPGGRAERDDQDVHPIAVPNDRTLRRDRSLRHDRTLRWIAVCAPTEPCASAGAADTAISRSGPGRHGNPPTGRGALGGHQVTEPFVVSGRSALKPGVRCSAMG